MSNHDEACVESSQLCDRLFEGLSKKIPYLQKSESQKWCSYFELGKRRFAYIGHRKTARRIEIWCLGDPSVLQEKTELMIEPRKPTTGGFGEQFQSRFYLDKSSEIRSAVHLLYSISFKQT
jgi:hypothetical protein